MSRLANIGAGSESGEKTVFAYGFDEAGFHTQRDSVALAGIGRIKFIPFYDSTSLDVADGVIIPQGIFEELEAEPSALGPKTYVRVDKTSLLERERQIFNLLRAGKWICFLVGEIVDEVSEGIHLESIHDTDLCKRILNAFTVGRRRRYELYNHTPPRHARAVESEFESYVSAYGAPTTVFELPHLLPYEKHVLVEFGDQPVGIEMGAQLFFLPFRAPEKSALAASSIAETVARAIFTYRQNRIVKLPSWVDEFRFKSEEKLYIEINSLLEKVNQLECQLLSWKEYKVILTASGDRLMTTMAAILESVFDFNLDIDKLHQRILIKNESQRPVLLIEVAGTEGSVEKQFIDRLQAHRQSLALPDRFPAVLCINHEMSIQDITKRAEARVPEDCVRYAKEHHVLIVRTVDFLMLMRQLETDPHRGKKLMHLLLAGGGWLRADLQTYRILDA
jgi:hypothetical protein